MNRATFFAVLRERQSGVFGTSLSQKQVEGVEAILDAGAHLDAPSLAYVLATAYHETGRSMYPNRENMFYSSGTRVLKVFGRSRLQGVPPGKLARNPKLLASTVYGGEWGRKNLGNIPGTDDGWIYRGGGMDHCTGRTNYKKASAAAGVDLLADPNRILDPVVAAKVMVSGMETGRYRGGHKLSTYILPGMVNFQGARAIINADVRKNGALVAGYARAFLRALERGGWKAAQSGPVVAKSPPPGISLPEKPASRGLWGILAALLRGWRG